MGALEKKEKLAAINTDTHEDHYRNNRARNTIFDRTHEDYITQVSDEIESRVLKKLSQEFSRTESLLLGALSRLNEFLLNP